MTRAAARTALALVALHAATLTLAAGDVSAAIQRCQSLREQGHAIAHTATWVCRTAAMARDLNLYGWVDGIAWAALLVFFVGRTLAISLDPAAGSKLRVFLTASMFGFALMLMLTPIRSGMFNVWQYSYVFSQTHGANAAITDLVEAANELRPEGAATALTAIGIGQHLTENAEAAAGIGVTGAATVGAAHTVTHGLSSLRQAAKGAGEFVKKLPIGRIVEAVLLPIMALYSITIYGSALAVIIGSLVLPMGGVMILAGSGGAFFSTWSKVMLGAILTMVVFPIMWGVSLDLAIVNPLLNFINEASLAYEQYEASVAAIQDAGRLNIVGTLRNLWELGKLAWGVFGSIAGMLVQVIVGAVVAFSLIFLLQQVITRFVGGIISHGRNGVIAAMFGGRAAAGARRESGESAGSDTSTSPEERQAAAARDAAAAGSARGGTGGGGPARPAEPLPASPGRVGRATVTPASDAAAPPPTGASPGRIGQAAINPADPGNAPPPSVARAGHIGQATVTYRGPAQTRDDFPDDFDAAPPRRRR